MIPSWMLMQPHFRDDAVTGGYRQPIPRLSVNTNMEPLKSELADTNQTNDRCIAMVKAAYRELQEKGDMKKDQRLVAYLCTVTKESYDVRNRPILGRDQFRALSRDERERRGKLPMHLRFIDS